MTNAAHAQIAAAATAEQERAVIQARSDLNRWINEGGNIPFEAAAVLHATRMR